MEAGAYDSMLQVIDSGVVGLPNDRFDFSPTLDSPFGGSSMNGSPGQCLISISNYNFFNSNDAKTLFPNSINMTNNISLRGAQQPMMNQVRYPERNMSTYPKYPGQQNLEHCSGEDSQKPRIRKRLRTIFTMQQVNLLEAAYNYSKYPTANIKKKLASRLELPVDRVQVWFQNKRTRDHRANKQKTEGALMGDEKKTPLECLASRYPKMRLAEKMEAARLDTKGQRQDIRTLLATWSLEME